jgi:LysR family hydrogen peroxide-inducible transcriptional activator
MNFNQIVYFEELVRQGSFSKAAAVLEISQPALSLQVQNLEKELNFKLVDRRTKPLKLTTEGEVFWQKCQEIINLIDSLKDIALDLEQKVEGVLKVGIIPTLAPYLVPLFINDINKKYPALIIEIEEAVTEKIISGIKSGQLDAGIVSTPLEVNGIYFQPLFYEHFYLYVSPKHPLYEKETIDIDEFNPEDLWYLQEGNCFQNQVNAICKLSSKAIERQTLVYNSNSLESLKRIVETRKGMTFIPELATVGIPSENEDMVKEISEKDAVREISLAVSRNVTKKKLIEPLVRTILASVPGRMHLTTIEKIIDTSLRF